MCTVWRADTCSARVIGRGDPQLDDKGDEQRLCRIHRQQRGPARKLINASSPLKQSILELLLQGCALGSMLVTVVRSGMKCNIKRHAQPRQAS